MTGHLRLVTGCADLVVPEVARATIDAHRLAVLRQDHRVDPLDGHALLCRLKVAVALMALDGRSVIDDTRLESRRTRHGCQRIHPRTMLPRRH